jgi:hypothetical protein
MDLEDSMDLEVSLDRLVLPAAPVLLDQLASLVQEDSMDLEVSLVHRVSLDRLVLPVALG